LHEDNNNPLQICMKHGQLLPAMWHWVMTWVQVYLDIVPQLKRLLLKL